MQGYFLSHSTADIPNENKISLSRCLMEFIGVRRKFQFKVLADGSNFED
jgi:hypothetical protein